MKNQENTNFLSQDFLLLLSNPNEFYDVVDTRAKIFLFVDNLHKQWCNSKGIKPLKNIVFKSIKSGSFGEYIKDKDITLNANFLKIFEKCKRERNTYFPFALARTCLHETRHYWQFCKLKDIENQSLSEGEKLAIATFSRFNSVFDQMESVAEKYRLEKSQTLMKVYSSQIKSLKQQLDEEYENAPHELDANNEVLAVFETIFAKTGSEFAYKACNELTYNVFDNLLNGKWSIEQVLKEKFLKEREQKIFSHFYKKFKDQDSNKNIVKLYPNLAKSFEEFEPLCQEDAEDIENFSIYFDEMVYEREI